MTLLLKGLPVSKKIEKNIETKLKVLKEKNIEAKIATVRVGNDADDIAYERSIKSNCKRLGIKLLNIVLDGDLAKDEILAQLELLNKDNSISGILLLSLLTENKNQDLIRASINPNKDIDAIHPINLERVFRGDIKGFAPCAAKAVMKILDYYDVEIAGKNVVIVNRSMVIGKPLAMMILSEDGTPEICHTKTKGLKEKMKSADIVITAIGEAKYFDQSYFNNNSIIIDIGIAMDENNKISGDIDFDSVNKNVKMLTPVPGGLGRVTTDIMIEHSVDAALKLNNIKY